MCGLSLSLSLSLSLPPSMQKRSTAFTQSELTATETNLESLFCSSDFDKCAETNCTAKMWRYGSSVAINTDNHHAFDSMSQPLEKVTE
jgi:hypothetical protein